MKKNFKAVIAMILVLSLGFMMLSTTAFAAAASVDDIEAPQAAGILDFFKSFFKKISDSIKSVFEKIIPSKGSDPEEPTTEINGSSADGGNDAIVDDEYSGKKIGSGDKYAGGIW